MPRIRGRSSDGRALQSHCRGQGFDSPRLHHEIITANDLNGTAANSQSYGLHAAPLAFAVSISFLSEVMTAPILPRASANGALAGS